MSITSKRAKHSISRIYIAVLLLSFTSICVTHLRSQTFTYCSLPLGTVSAMAEDKAGRLYIGCGSGIFTSSDHGETWSRYALSNSYQATFTNSITVFQDSLLATATASSGIRVMSNGKWKSRNAGLPTSANSYTNFRAIVCDSSGNLIAGGCKTVLVEGGLYICKDTTWNLLSKGLDTLNILSLVVNPNGTVYCGTQGKGVYALQGDVWAPVNTGLNDLHINSLACNRDGTLYAGTDAGCSVLKPGNGYWTNYTLDIIDKLPVLSLSISPTNNNLILASLGNTKEHVGMLTAKVFISSDGGATWVESLKQVQTLAAQSSCIDQAGNFYVGAQGVFKSTNAGTNWSASNIGFRDGLITGSGFVINAKGYVFLATSNGVFRSKDRTKSWEMLNKGLMRPQISLLFCDSKDNLYAGAFVGKIGSSLSARMYRSTNDGDSWDSLRISPDDQYCQMAEGPIGTLYCSHGFSTKPGLSEFSPSSLAKSTDFGLSWHDLDVTAGMGYGVAVNKRGHVFHGGETNGPYLSTDGGLTWQKDMPIENSGNIVCTISPFDEVFTYSYGPHCLWYSDSASNGHPFVNLTSPTFPQYKVPTCFAWGKNNRLYIGIRAFAAASGVYYTDYPISESSEFSPITSFQNSPFAMQWDRDGYLWLQGPNFVAVSDSVLGNPKAATTISTSDLEQTDSMVLHPNPTSEQLHLLFTPAHTSSISNDNTTIRIYSSLGLLVKEFATTPGTLEQRMTVSDLAAGAYYLRYGDSTYSFVIR